MKFYKILFCIIYNSPTNVIMKLQYHYKGIEIDTIVAKTEDFKN